jgi:ABC-type multidrug transport system ATPase subunit
METENKVYDDRSDVEYIAEYDSLPPLKLSWHDLNYTIKVKTSIKKNKVLDSNARTLDKEILKPQSGYVNSGETMFIMGSSGAGKTTLLNALCDRLPKNRSARVDGKVMINDTYQVNQKAFGKYGAYVMQDDVLFATLTCIEAITFSAKLRTGLSGEKLQKRIEKVIDNLGLRKC